MTGLVGLVPLAELLAEAVGSRQGAVRLAAEILHRGASALPRGNNNVVYAARRQLVAVGVIAESGVVAPHRAAELMIICEVLAASTLPRTAHPPEPRLVLSAPIGTAPIADVERLDGLVLDVIRQATVTLHVGGAFWNDEGFERLDEVLLPALTVRAVTAVIYVNNPPEERYRGPLKERLDQLVATGQVALRWFSGPRPTMLHAKFVIARPSVRLPRYGESHVLGVPGPHRSGRPADRRPGGAVHRVLGSTRSCRPVCRRAADIA